MHQILPGRMLVHRDPWTALDVHQVGVVGHGGKEVLPYATRGGVRVEALGITEGEMVGSKILRIVSVMKLSLRQSNSNSPQ